MMPCKAKGFQSCIWDPTIGKEKQSEGSFLQVKEDLKMNAGEHFGTIGVKCIKKNPIQRQKYKNAKAEVIICLLN